MIRTTTYDRSPKLNFSQAAEYVQSFNFSIDRHGIRDMVDAGELNYHQVGKRRYVSEKELIDKIIAPRNAGETNAA